MSLLETRWLVIDVESLEENGSAQLQVKLVTTVDGGLERTAGGVRVKSAGITDAMLAGNIAFTKLADYDVIARLDQNETITGKWDFPDENDANVPTLNGKPLTTKDYVDALIQGLAPKEPVLALADSNQTLSGLPSDIDGVTSWSAGDRILLTAQTTASENGIWEVQSGAWTRPADFATGSHAASAFVFVQEGTTWQDTGWVCSTDTADGDVVDTDNLTFVQFSSAGVIDAGAGLGKTGNTIYVVPSKLVKGGDAELPGDELKVAYTPTNYTPTITPETSNTDTLGAHLKGLDDAISAVGRREVDRFTLSATDVTNKYVTLSSTPKSANRVTLAVRGAPQQEYGDDYVMDGTNPDRLTWAGLGLDGMLAAGDKLRVVYDI